MSPPPALVLDDVSRRFGRRWALARVSYTLPAGRALLLTGHNGSGKSTLLRLIATAIRPTAGNVRVRGHDTREQTEQVRREVALLSHDSFLYEDLTAHQNLLVLGRLLGRPDPAADSRALLERMGLSARASHPVRHFSAGMRKRLAIARMLAQRPKLALLDEPFGELDPAGILHMEQVIGTLRAEGVGIILATHLVEQGERLCDERLHLVDGRRVAP